MLAGPDIPNLETGSWCMGVFGTQLQIGRWYPNRMTMLTSQILTQQLQCPILDTTHADCKKTFQKLKQEVSLCVRLSTISVANCRCAPVSVHTATSATEHTSSRSVPLCKEKLYIKKYSKKCCLSHTLNSQANFKLPTSNVKSATADCPLNHAAVCLMQQDVLICCFLS